MNGNTQGLQVEAKLGRLTRKAPKKGKRDELDRLAEAKEQASCRSCVPLAREQSQIQFGELFGTLRMCQIWRAQRLMCDDVR